MLAPVVQGLGLQVWETKSLLQAAVYCSKCPKSLSAGLTLDPVSLYIAPNAHMHTEEPGTTLQPGLGLGSGLAQQ